MIGKLFSLVLAAACLWGVAQGWALYVTDPFLPLRPVFVAVFAAGVVLGTAHGLVVAWRAPRDLRIGPLHGAMGGFTVSGLAVFLFVLGADGVLGELGFIDSLRQASVLEDFLTLVGFTGVYGGVLAGTSLMGYTAGSCLTPDKKQTTP